MGLWPGGFKAWWPWLRFSRDFAFQGTQNACNQGDASLSPALAAAAVSKSATSIGHGPVTPYIDSQILSGGSMDEDNKPTIRTIHVTVAGSIWLVIGLISLAIALLVGATAWILTAINAPGPAGVGLWIFGAILAILLFANFALIGARLLNLDRHAKSIVDVSSHFTNYLRLGG